MSHFLSCITLKGRKWSLDDNFTFFIFYNFFIYKIPKPTEACINQPWLIFSVCFYGFINVNKKLLFSQLFVCTYFPTRKVFTFLFLNFPFSCISPLNFCQMSLIFTFRGWNGESVHFPWLKLSMGWNRKVTTFHALKQESDHFSMFWNRKVATFHALKQESTTFLVFKQHFPLLQHEKC